MPGFEARVVPLSTPERTCAATLGLGLLSDSARTASSRLMHSAVRLSRVPAPLAARLESLVRQLGGEAVLAGLAGQDRERKNDVTLIASLSQYGRLLVALRASPRGGVELAKAIDDALRVYCCEPEPTMIGGREFRWGPRTYLMGIVNVTPDSFSGDGLATEGDEDDLVQRALQVGRRQAAEGADMVDVGGESTRPGHALVDVEEELRRVVPVVAALARELTVPVCVDTSKSEVARQSLQAGAAMINDVSGLRADVGMASVLAEAGVPVVVMHNSDSSQYTDLMAEVIAWLRHSLDTAVQAGIAEHNIIVDPGFGFGKSWKQNLSLIAELAQLRSLGHPILVGTSRKSTIGKVLDLPVPDRLEGTAATVAVAVHNGADIMRVHDVAEMARVCRMTDAIVRRTWQGCS